MLYTSILYIYCIYSVFIENVIYSYPLWISTCILNLNKFSFKGRACYIKVFPPNMYWYLLLYLCMLNADGSMCIASVSYRWQHIRYSFSSKAVGKAAWQFILCSISGIREKGWDWDTVRTCTTYWYSVLWNYNKTYIKDRKLLLLFPQFIKYKTFELLWNSRI